MKRFASMLLLLAPIYFLTRCQNLDSPTGDFGDTSLFFELKYPGTNEDFFEFTSSYTFDSIKLVYENSLKPGGLNVLPGAFYHNGRKLVGPASMGVDRFFIDYGNGDIDTITLRTEPSGLVPHPGVSKDLINFCYDLNSISEECLNVHDLFITQQFGNRNVVYIATFDPIAFALYKTPEQ